MRSTVFVLLAFLTLLTPACRSSEVRVKRALTGPLDAFRSAQIIVGTKIAASWDVVVEFRDELADALKDREIFEAVSIVEEREPSSGCLLIQVWISHGTLLGAFVPETLVAEVKLTNAASGELLGEYEVSSKTPDPILVGGAIGEAVEAIADLVEREASK